MFAPFRSRGLMPYIVGSISLVIAWAVRFVFDPVLGAHASFSFFFLAVSVSAWMGGIRPAVVMTALSCLVGNYFFSHPYGSFRISGHEEVFELLIFVAVSVVIGTLSEISLGALERARIAERAKDNFLATLAHEMRSPLTVIHYANTLNRISATERPNDQSELIDRQVQHLNLMIQDLLDASRIARGKIRLDRRHIDASSIVVGAIEKAKLLMASHQHTLKIDVAPDAMPLYADPVRLEQVLTNLLANAAKYTPDGGEIDVRVEPVHDSAVFRVRDNGIGIPAETLPQIFDLFVQVDSASDRSEGGLGIGLALVRKLVEMHGGNVSATSAGPNQGSEFIVSLPLERTAPSRAALVEA